MTTSPFPAALQDELQRGLSTLGLDAATLAPPLLQYLALLDRWNHTYNLTAIRDPRDMVTRHLLDSLAMHPFVERGTLADLGTGPGLPGIPLAIAKPDLQVTLVESNGKKARFLREAVRTLGLGNARVAESRAEAVDEPGAYDALTARHIQVGDHDLGTLCEEPLDDAAPDSRSAGQICGCRRTRQDRFRTGDTRHAHDPQPGAFTAGDASRGG